MAKCQHGAFVVKSEVRRMRHTPDGPVVAYQVENEVACYDCGMIFIVPPSAMHESKRFLKGHRTMKVADA